MTAKLTFATTCVPAALQRIVDAGIPVVDDGRPLVQAGGHRSLLVADELADDVRELLDDLVVEGGEPKPKAKKATRTRR